MHVGSMLTSLPLFVAVVTTFAKASQEELCVIGDCSAGLKAQSLLQRKHISAAPAKALEELPTTKDSADAPACEGVDTDGRCWYLSEKGESCESACLKHGRSFKFKMPKSEKSIVSMLLKKEPLRQEGPWRAFECYKPEEDHLHLVSHCSANDYRDNQGSWSDPDCQLACPCGGTKECSWKQPEACVPVFQYKDNQLTGCPKLDSERPWCSHAHDKTDDWSYCGYSCTDASANGATELFTEPPFPEGADEIEMVSMDGPDAVVLKSGSTVAYAASDLKADLDLEKNVEAHASAAVAVEIKETKALPTLKEENTDAPQTAITGHRSRIETLPRYRRSQESDIIEQPSTIKKAEQSVSAIGLDSEDDDKNPPVEKETEIHANESAKMLATKDINQHSSDTVETASQSVVSESSGVVQQGDLSSDPEKGDKDKKSEDGQDKNDKKEDDDKTDSKKGKDDEAKKEKDEDKSDSKKENAEGGDSENKSEESSEKNGAIQLSWRPLPLLALPSVVACLLTGM